MGIGNFFKNTFGGHFVTDEDYGDSAISPEDYEGYEGEAEENENSGSIYDNDSDNDGDNGYSYSPYGAPEYNFSSNESKSSNFEAPKYDAPKHESSQKRESSKSGAHIYNMNTARPANKFKLNSILLRDIYDAKNVAELMMEKNTIVVVNLSQLSEEQKIRSMDFLDGAKFVTKSHFARFAENICAFVPDSVELFGDFFSQIDMDSFR